MWWLKHQLKITYHIVWWMDKHSHQKIFKSALNYCDWCTWARLKQHFKKIRHFTILIDRSADKLWISYISIKRVQFYHIIMKCLYCWIVASIFALSPSVKTMGWPLNYLLWISVYPPSNSIYYCWTYTSSAVAPPLNPTVDGLYLASLTKFSKI